MCHSTVDIQPNITINIIENSQDVLHEDSDWLDTGGTPCSK